MSAHRIIYRALLAALAGVSLLHLHAQATDAQGIVSVEVFANSAMHITPSSPQGLPYTLHIYRLDTLQQLEASLNQQLPKTEAEALRWLQDNQARIRRKLTPQAVQAANGLTLAAHYLLSRIPAIVINKRVAVYGVTDVHQAIGLMLAKEQKP